MVSCCAKGSEAKNVEGEGGLSLHGRTPNTKEKAWLDVVSQLGCIVCREHLGVFSPAEIHHIDGKTKPNAHMLTLPLCPPHHRLPGKGHVSRADGKPVFEKAFGSEFDLHAKVVDLVAEHWGCCV